MLPWLKQELNSFVSRLFSRQFVTENTLKNHFSAGKDLLKLSGKLLYQCAGCYAECAECYKLTGKLPWPFKSVMTEVPSV